MDYFSLTGRQRRSRGMPIMEHTLRFRLVQTLNELKQAHAFAVSVPGLPTARHMLENYAEQFGIAPQLMVVGWRYSPIVGCALHESLCVPCACVVDPIRNRQSSIHNRQFLEAFQLTEVHQAAGLGDDALQERQARPA